jgi:hypothetical protein
MLPSSGDAHSFIETMPMTAQAQATCDWFAARAAFVSLSPLSHAGPEMRRWGTRDMDRAP